MPSGLYGRVGRLFQPQERSHVAVQEAPPVEEDEPKQMRLPKFEGYSVTEHYLNFGGNIKLADQDVVDAIALGKDVTFVIRGKVVARTHKGKDDEAGNRTGASASSVVVVSSISTYDE
jgi:hypothetical protein